MADLPSERRFIFPRWVNYLLPVIVVGFLGGAAYVPVLVGFGASPNTTDVGYAPQQPVEYSHALHVGKLGIDCRYCHSTVDSAAFAAIPPTQTCMNCHTNVKSDSPKLAALRQSWASGEPVKWRKIHDLPDYAYFNHSAHVTKGISCVECHGRIDQMEVVHQAKPLSMGWCLECHRAPENHLRPADVVTNLGWTVEQLKQTHPELERTVRAKFELPADKPVTQKELGLYLKNEQFKIHGQVYMQSCSTCHR